MSRKAAIELSLNFMIGIIIGIALLSFGIYFLGRIMEVDFDGGLPDSYIEAARACYVRGDRVCIVEKRMEIRVRKYSSFGLVINNMLGEKKEFKPVVKFSMGLTDKGQTINPNSITLTDWTYSQMRAYDIENNDYELISVPFTVPGGTQRGEYNFNVYVCYNSNAEPSDFCPAGYKSLYGPVSQITIRVP